MNDFHVFVTRLWRYVLLISSARERSKVKITPLFKYVEVTLEQFKRLLKTHLFGA